MTEYLQVLFFSLVGGLFSLVGGMIFLSRRSNADKLAKYAPPFAAGALLAVSFLELLPESIEVAPESALVWALVGLVAFFILEHVLHWFHHHHNDDHEHVKSAAPLIIIGDTVHNFIDGIAIGAAFIINPSAGIVTAIAVAAHEIPQEIGDFGLLIKAGYERKRVLLINVFSSLATAIGALLTFWLGSQFELPLGALLAIAAGMFIYIAASDLIPAIHDEAKHGRTRLPILLLLLGIIIVALATSIAHEKLHQYESHDNGHSTELQHGHTEDVHEEDSNH